ncbi:asparagine synthase-related protein [Sphingomonas sp.]|jgi:asparagine synthase (glutamine-hydrolysing)|uniref:asparagine synthase-related protein n=1 Tax=Sphingomonas sp. TaxID=28214 RepID=UPI002E31372D|nr:asparagine synthase-related protein [Sphingomonas sp.]HEX4693591.1 asparagine synthase-related protein [Sphingomonas sp.]
MRPRYLGCWSPDDSKPAVAAIAAADPGLPVRVDTPHLALAADPSLPLLAIDDCGIVIGAVFGDGRPNAFDAFDLDDRTAIAASRGGVLVERHWGSYLAVLPPGESEELTLCRGPFGHLSCYTRWAQGRWWFASDAALLAAAGGAPPFDPDALARHLAYPELADEETCLGGVHDLRGGDRVVLGAGGTRHSRTCWSPWSFAERATRCTDRDEASRRIRDATRLAVTAHASLHDRVLLLLSGGLDSSIVAACLKSNGGRASALTFVTTDRIGDEREFARIAAAGTGLDLTERFRESDGVCFERSAAASLPRPMARAFNQESHRLATVEARSVGATAIFDGGGGDNLFCSHRSVAAVADCLLTDGFGQAFAATARALGSLTHAGLPRVVAGAIKRAWFRPAGLRLVRDTSFLSPRAAAIGVARPDHPWLVAPPGALPGRAVHVSLLATAQASIESGGVAGEIDRVSPIVTQPVAEACLQIPSHFWFAPGHDRAAARRAFADALPARIIDRRSKGSPAPFAASLLEQRRESLKPFLLDGVLAGHGLLDTEAVRAFLDDPAPQRGFGFTRFLTVIDAEAWARNWA